MYSSMCWCVFAQNDEHVSPTCHDRLLQLKYFIFPAPSTEPRPYIIQYICTYSHAWCSYEPLQMMKQQNSFSLVINLVIGTLVLLAKTTGVRLCWPTTITTTTYVWLVFCACPAKKHARVSANFLRACHYFVELTPARFVFHKWYPVTWHPTAISLVHLWATCLCVCVFVCVCVIGQFCLVIK